MSNRTTKNYALRDGRKVVYYGTTTDLDRRMAEHQREGKQFTSMTQVGRSKTVVGAKALEAQMLAGYRRGHGGVNPKYNKTENG